MTYGESTDHMRSAVTELLRQHRILHRLGSGGSTFPATTTAEQRQVLGQQIARYRHGVLTWCLEAVDAAYPRLDPNAARYGRPGGPIGELQQRLRSALAHSSSGLPTPEEISTAHDVRIVELWRTAARAAILGERDLPIGTRPVSLTRSQCATLIADAAAISEAVALLDLRYKNIPGWEHLHGRGHLARAAAGCADLTTAKNQDYTVDLTGWRPPTRRIDGPPRPGIGGVLQAQHNLVVALTEFPSGLNLRRILESQRLLSAKLADMAGAHEPNLGESWSRRAETYTALVHHTRNLRGLIGNGGVAAAEAANAVSRLSVLPRQQTTGGPALRHLDALCVRLDARLVQIIEHGAEKKLYLLRARMPELADRPHKGIIPSRTQYVPITTPLGNDLLRTVRERLRPEPPRPAAPPEGRVTRRDLTSALDSQPRSALPSGHQRAPGTAPPFP